MEIKSEKLKYWVKVVEEEGFKQEDTEIMKKHWDNVEDAVFLFVMNLLV
jgi:hypothetical protein